MSIFFQLFLFWFSFNIINFPAIAMDQLEEESSYILIPRIDDEYNKLIEVPYAIAAMSATIKDMIEDSGAKDWLGETTSSYFLPQISAPILELVVENLIKMQAMEPKIFRALKLNIERSLSQNNNINSYYDFYYAAIYLELEDDFVIAAAAALIDKRIKSLSISQVEEELRARIPAKEYGKYFDKQINRIKYENIVELKLPNNGCIYNMVSSGDNLYVISKIKTMPQSASKVTKIDTRTNLPDANEVFFSAKLQKAIAENNSLYLFSGNKELVLTQIQWNQETVNEKEKTIFQEQINNNIIVKNNSFYYLQIDNGIVSRVYYEPRGDCHIEITRNMPDLGYLITKVLYAGNKFYVVTWREKYWMSIIDVNTRKIEAEFELAAKVNEMIIVGNKIYLINKENKPGLTELDTENFACSKFIPYNKSFSKIIVSGTDLIIVDNNSENVEIFDTLLNRIVGTINIKKHSGEIVSINSLLYVLNNSKNIIRIFDKYFDLEALNQDN